MPVLCAMPTSFIMKKDRKKYMKEYYQKNKVEIKAKIKEYKENNKEKIKKWKENNKELIKEHRKKDYLTHLPQYKARKVAYKKIKIPKGQICVKCKKELATERHHEDYDKPLEVELVCKKCHIKLDKIKQQRDKNG